MDNALKRIIRREKDDSRKEGRSEGRRLESEETVKRMIEIGLEDEIICRSLNCSLDRVQEIRSD